jgi:hypothetical protein
VFCSVKLFTNQAGIAFDGIRRLADCLSGVSSLNGEGNVMMWAELGRSTTM